ncbi:MAG TPA: hypothetical protein VGM04_01900 [Sphingomicrobium sp.]|jgi:hypothetical protein
MTRGLVLAVALLVPSSVAYAGASNFTLVNGTKVSLSNLSVRRVGTEDWKPLGTAPDAGGRGPISFKDQDCAFDIRAEVKDKGAVTWANVNLCDVKSVTLNQDPSAGAWVDYDH